MAEKKIGAKLVIDGEAEFRANLTSAKTAMSKFQNELKLVNTVYKDNANSLAALRDKQQVYINLQEEQRNKVRLLTDIQDKAVKKYEEEQKMLSGLKQKKEELNTALEKAKEEYGENSEEVKNLTDELTDANDQYEAQQRIVQKTGDRVNRYKSDLNGAEAELAELNDEVKRNEQYLAEAENSIDGCATSIDQYGNEVEDSADKTSIFADVLKAELLSSAIKEGIKAIANGIKKIATSATQTGITFEASMSQVAATMGITTKEIANGSAEYELLSKAAQDCGKATMFSASQSAEALNYLALAGYDAEKAAATLPRVLNLAAAGGLELSYASDLVTDSMAALGLETSELDKYIDEMAKTSQKSNTSVAQLGEATLVCAGTVALTGQSLETMNTALGVMANNGLKGAEGGTHLRNVLLSLSAPTDKAASAIKSLGLRVYDSKGNMRDLNAILTDMNNLTSDMTRGDKTQLINTIFNKTDIAAVNALLKSTNGEYSDLNAQINDCSGAAQAMADTLNDNLKGRVTILQSALEGLGITAYNLFDDEMKSAVDSATDAVGRLQEEIDSGDLGVSLRNMSTALGEFAVNAIGAAENALPMLIDGLTWLLEHGEIVAGLIGGVTTAKIAYSVATEAATVAQKLFNVTANANPYILLATAISGVIGAITLYAKTADKETVELTESTKKLTDASKKLNDETAEAVQKREKATSNLENERNACVKLVDELEALQSKTELTASEQARQTAIVEELNTLMPELNLSIDEQTGLTNMSTEALRGNIDAQMELIKLQAAREQQKEITDELVEAEIRLTELTAEQEAAKNRLAEADERINVALAEQGEHARVSEEALEEYARAEEDIEALRIQIEETTGTVDCLKVEYEQTAQYVAKTEAFADAAEAIKTLGDIALGTGDDITTMSDDVIEEYNKMYIELQKDIEGQIDLFSKFSVETKISSEEILENMQSQIDGVSEWAENMDELADRGINRGLLKYLADMGPQGAGYVAAFVNMTDEQLKNANKMFEESAQLSHASAANITDSYFDAGQDAAQGFIDGASGDMDKVVAAAKELGENALNALKTDLDIHSPSKKTMELGESFNEGLQKGIDNKTKNVLNVIKQLTKTMLTETKTGTQPKEYEHIGAQIIEGFKNGIESGKSKILESIRSMCEQTIQTARDKLDIHSPSKAFAYLGKMSGEGYTSGWKDSMKDIDSVIIENLPDMVVLNDEMRGAYEKMVEDAKGFCQQILGVNTAIKTVGDEYDETMLDIADDTSVTKACENMDGLGKAALNTSEDITIMSKETIKAYAEMYSSIAEKVENQIDLFATFDGKAKMSSKDMLKNMRSQVIGVAQWAADMSTLADRGINKGLLQHLADMGPTGAGYVSTFISMTNEELIQANKLFETSLALPDTTAMLITDSFAAAGTNAARGFADQIILGTNEVYSEYEKMVQDAETFCQQILGVNTAIKTVGDEYDETMLDIADDTSVTKACENMDGLGKAALNTSEDISVMSRESIEAYQEMYSSVVEKVDSQIDLFSEFSGKSKMSAEDLLKNMQSQVTGVSQWATDMNTLADRGINQGLLQHLADMGPTGAGYVSTFVSMTDEELVRANRLFETSLVLPDATATLVANSFAQAGNNAAKGFADGIVSNTNEVVDASESMSCDALDTVMTTLDEHSPSKKTEEMGKNFAEGLRKGIDERKVNVLNVVKLLTNSMLISTKKSIVEDEYMEIGRQVAEGMRNGIESGRSAVLESVRTLCEETIQAARDKLDIHSPSKAFAYLGKMSGEGYITGWEDTIENINNTIADTFPDVPDASSHESVSVVGADTSRLSDMCEKIYSIIAQYMPRMSKMQMVLDTGAMIGQLVPRIDKELGDIGYYKSRGGYE